MAVEHRHRTDHRSVPTALAAAALRLRLQERIGNGRDRAQAVSLGERRASVAAPHNFGAATPPRPLPVPGMPKQGVTLSSLHDRAGRERSLMPAVTALIALEATAVDQAMMLTATTRASEAIGPACLLQSRWNASSKRPFCNWMPLRAMT
jgi:hypothetical protein